MLKQMRTQHTVSLRLSEAIFAQLEAEASYSGNSIQGVVRHVLAEHYAHVRYPVVSE